MKAAVIVFPGTNCDRDVAVTLKAASGVDPVMVWHGESALPQVDLIVLPGGFSYGDYLRSGAMGAHSPIMREVVKEAGRGVAVLGICNGFQILTEAKLLPGALMRNAGLRYICRPVRLKVDRNDTIYTGEYAKGEHITLPVGHKDGNYFADDELLARLEGEGQIVLRYANDNARAGEHANPNGSRHNIAGLINHTGRVMGLMPHPERASDSRVGGADGWRLFLSLTKALDA